ncbi:MAG TPA: CbiX/SirB N-terminal domain-containing protein [Burkholderiales bacterium]|jgi:sirohydrochlorin cobaltochelatase|nr:CbiX/SirB N-terminal domain-containing protein [Burkholderiales bacterium]
MAERAIVLFAHGARDPDWARPFRRLALELAERAPGERIALAFLELMHPSLSECIGTLYAEGVRRFRVVPVFFGAGSHLKEDLPNLAESIRSSYKDLEIRLDPPVGEQPEVISALARAISGG